MRPIKLNRKENDRFYKHCNLAQRRMEELDSDKLQRIDDNTNKDIDKDTDKDNADQ